MTFNVPQVDEVNDNVKQVFNTIKEKAGQLPNIYAFIGNSENALKNYLQFNQGQAGGTFSAREREAVFLAVSELNGCEYCQSAHTALGKMNGLTEEETLQIRAGRHSNPKLNALIQLAKEIQNTKGNPDKALIENFREQGFEEEALVDLVSLVVDVSFTNYIHNIAQFEIDFPKAKKLSNKQAA